jgi:hypothetical protein
MNCDKLSDLSTEYQAKQTALRDLADLWTSKIRDKKAPKRKQVRSWRLLILPALLQLLPPTSSQVLPSPCCLADTLLLYEQ